MTMLGPYTLVQQLGVGGMGEVWLGRWSGPGGATKSVAIKVLTPEKARDANAKRMFLDEARLSMLLTNSNIVQVFGVGEAEDGVCYMAMEFVDGLDLSKLIERLAETGERLSISLIAYIIGEVLKALAYAHELDHDGKRLTLVHRDISPHNVMVSVWGEVKVMDFGIARMASEETSGLHVKGKLRYMPPEQLQGGAREPTIDIFAVGAVLHELIEGKKFRGNVMDEARLIGMIFAGEVPPLTDPPGPVPREITELLAGMLAADVKQRIGSARAAHRKLASWSGYRDAKFDLEEIVRRFCGPSASRPALAVSGDVPTISAQVNAPQEPILGHKTEILAERSQTTVNRENASLEHTGDQTASTRETQVTVARVSRTTAPRKGNSIYGALALASVGVMFGMFGAAAWLGWWRSVEPVSAVEPSPATEPSPAVEPSPAKEPSPAIVGAVGTSTNEPALAAPPALDAPLQQIPQQPSDAPTTSARDDQRDEPVTEVKKVVAKVPLTIKLAKGKVFTEVDIANKKYKLDLIENTTSITVKLKPGDYPVSYREDVDGVWRDAGKITVPTTGPVTLEVVGKRAVLK